MCFKGEQVNSFSDLNTAYGQVYIYVYICVCEAV
jgi:hypothetical protein